MYPKNDISAVPKRGMSVMGTMIIVISTISNERLYWNGKTIIDWGVQMYV